MHMATDEAPERLLTVEDIRQRLQVNPQSVRKWLRDGELRGIRFGRRGGWRVREADFQAFLRKRSGGQYT